MHLYSCFFFQAEDGIRDWSVTGVQTCALPIYPEICDPESHKTRDLERLIVSSQGGVSNTVVFLRDISRGKLTTSPNPDASSTKSAAATSPTFCCCRRMPSCG